MENPSLVISTLLKHSIKMDDQKFTPEEKLFREELEFIDQSYDCVDYRNTTYYYGGFELLVKLDPENKEWVLIYTKGDTDFDDDCDVITAKFSTSHNTVVNYWMYEPNILELMVVAFKPIVDHFFTQIGFPDLQRSLYHSGEL